MLFLFPTQPLSQLPPKFIFVIPNLFRTRPFYKCLYLSLLMITRSQRCSWGRPCWRSECCLLWFRACLAILSSFLALACTRSKKSVWPLRQDCWLLFCGICHVSRAQVFLFLDLILVKRMKKYSRSCSVSSLYKTNWNTVVLQNANYLTWKKEAKRISV